MLVNELKSLLSRFHIKPDKRLGQNFLLSNEVLDKIVEAAELKNKDKVLEIGPGLGSLTTLLAGRAGNVIAVEKDRKLCRALHKIFRNKKNVKIVCGDALRLAPDVEGFPPDFAQLSSENTDGYKVVANIPYYLTGKILQNFLTAKFKPKAMVLLLQQEVAQRIVSKPGDMSVLSISVQFYADPQIIEYVSKENFYPVPDVDSAIVRLRVLDKPRIEVDEKKLFQLVKIGFSNKRKQLHNNLRAIRNPNGTNVRKFGYPFAGSDYMRELLLSIGLNPLCRAQDLSLQDWEKLYNRIG